jgi:ubiquinone/menaquinone biosynthesis C-methylase UbiE
MVDSESILMERERMLAENKRRGTTASSLQPNEPWFMVARQDRERHAASLLARAGFGSLQGHPCLEVGFGQFGWLNNLINLGARESDLHGVELDPIRVEQARSVFPVADLREGDASALPWQDETFDLVVASTLFTSILSPEVRRMVALEITRVLANGGALLWYDFRFNNPRNPNVRKVTREELKELFPTLSGEIQSVTLAMPLLRLVAPRSWMLAQVLSAAPFLRTHLIALLRKPAR